eukprot:81691-Alexandrium_andersonii.AAC.1
MSASLVGSEMCIRDRRSGVPTWLKFPARGLGLLWLCLGGSSAANAGRTCLLYTSDAADDM